MLEPVRTYGSPLLVGLQAMPFTVLQSAFDGLYPAGLQWYWRADFFNEISDAAIDVHLKYGEQLPTGHSTMHMYPIDGAASRVPADATAFAYRDGGWAGVIVGVDPDPANADLISQWARDYWEELHPTSAGGAYVNFMMDEGQDRVKSVLPRQLRPAHPDQGPLRPGQHLPHQPEHQARQRAHPVGRTGRARPAHRGQAHLAVELPMKGPRHDARGCWLSRHLNDIGFTPSPHHHTGCMDDGTCPPAAFQLPALRRHVTAGDLDGAAPVTETAVVPGMRVCSG